MWRAIAQLYAVIGVLVVLGFLSAALQRWHDDRIVTANPDMPALQWSFYPHVDQNLRCWVVESQHNAHAVAMWCERYQP